VIKVLIFENAFALERVRGSVPMWKGLSLEGEMCYVSKCESKSHIE